MAIPGFHLRRVYERRTFHLWCQSEPRLRSTHGLLPWSFVRLPCRQRVSHLLPIFRSLSRFLMRMREPESFSSQMNIIRIFLLKGFLGFIKYAYLMLSHNTLTTRQDWSLTLAAIPSRMLRVRISVIHWGGDDDNDGTQRGGELKYRRRLGRERI